MVAATGGGLGPVLTGLIYCTAIACCSQLYVMDRAREWTAALAGWCAAQPDLVPFSGTCLVHRAELMQLGGSWPEAIDEARRASERVLACGRLAGECGRALPAGRGPSVARRFRGGGARLSQRQRAGARSAARPGVARAGAGAGGGCHQRDSRGAHGEHGSPATRPPAARRRRDSACRRGRRRGAARLERAGRDRGGLRDGGAGRDGGARAGRRRAGGRTAGRGAGTVAARVPRLARGRRPLHRAPGCAC